MASTFSVKVLSSSLKLTQFFMTRFGQKELARIVPFSTFLSGFSILRVLSNVVNGLDFCFENLKITDKMELTKYFIITILD